MANHERGFLYHQAGIKQGTVIRLNEHTCLIVSQNCDISYAGPDDTVIEYILIQHDIPATQGTQEGRNARLWQFTFDNTLYSAYAQHFEKIDKQTLEQALQDGAANILGFLDESQVKKLKSWRTFRYNRPAWPDEFINRLGRSKEKIEKLLIQEAPELRSLLLKLDNYEELDKHHIYKPTIALIYNEDPFALQSDNTYSFAYKTMTLLSRFHACEGIEVDDFIESVQLILKEYTKTYPQAVVDINELLNQTSSLINIAKKIDQKKLAEIMAPHMLGSSDISLYEYDSYQPFTEDWMSYKGKNHDHTPGKK